MLIETLGPRFNDPNSREIIMNNELTTFTFNASITDIVSGKVVAQIANRIRVVTIAGNPWFVVKDAAEVLGFSTKCGMGWLTRHIEASESTTVYRSNITVGDVSFPNRGAVCISESGLYKLIMRSDKPDAKPFQDWVTKVVLPAIRKDGAYVMGEEKVATGEMSEDELVFRAYDILKKKVERLTAKKIALA